MQEVKPGVRRLKGQGVINSVCRILDDFPDSDQFNVSMSREGSGALHMPQCGHAPSLRKSSHTSKRQLPSHRMGLLFDSGSFGVSCTTAADRDLWLKMLQQVIAERRAAVNFNHVTGNRMLDGQRMTLHRQAPLRIDEEGEAGGEWVAEDVEMIFIPEHRDDSQGWLHVRVWWEAKKERVNVMLINATNLPIADSNGLSDPFVELAVHTLHPHDMQGHTQTTNNFLLVGRHTACPVT